MEKTCIFFVKENVRCSRSFPLPDLCALGGHPLSTYARIFRETNISNSLIRTGTCLCLGVRNVRFLENFAYVINGRSLVYNSFHDFITFHDITNSILALSLFDER